MSAPTTPAGLLLMPGSGGDPDHPALVAVQEAVEAVGVPVRRFGLGAPERDGRGPTSPRLAVARLRAEADRWAADLGADPSRLLLGGRSFGGRMSSVAVAEGQPAAGLVLLSYPLHPPGRPDQLRTAHLPEVGVPVLAVSGVTDPYGSPAELAEHLAAVRGPLRLVTVAGPHLPTDADEVARAVAEWVATLGMIAAARLYYYG